MKKFEDEQLNFLGKFFQKMNFYIYFINILFYQILVFIMDCIYFL